MSLQQIFSLVEKKSHLLRKKDKHADGQKFWQPIKQLLSEVKINVKSWKRIDKRYDAVLDMPEYVINGREEKNIIEVNHFLIQTIRIPLNEEPSLRKIIQVALNIGQYTGSGKEKEKWMTLDNYLSASNIKKINEELKKLQKNLFDQLKQILE